MYMICCRPALPISYISTHAPFYVSNANNTDLWADQKGTMDCDLQWAAPSYQLYKKDRVVRLHLEKETKPARLTNNY